jgi:hypothetical protein
MRQYEPIWGKLKSLSPQDASSKGISISAIPKLHPRIIKAVKKEKWLDAAYKLSLYHSSGKTATLVVSRNNSILTFKLAFSLSIIDVGGIHIP